MMTTHRWILLLLVGLFAIHLVSLPPASCRPFEDIFFDREAPFEPPPWNTLVPYLLLAKTILASVNSILLTILLAIYIGIYRTTRSQFSLGLLIFSMALLLYSLTSNPLLHMFAGFRGTGLGPFTMLPDLFTCIASAILLYLSRQ
jgi:hypothetical protein